MQGFKTAYVKHKSEVSEGVPVRPKLVKVAVGPAHGRRRKQLLQFVVLEPCGQGAVSLGFCRTRCFNCYNSSQKCNSPGLISAAPKRLAWPRLGGLHLGAESGH